MNSRHSILALAITAATTCALADGASTTSSLSYTDMAPYTDVVPSGARTAAGTRNVWKGTLSREEVSAALREARSSGTVPVGDAVGYPYPMKVAPATAAAPGATPTETQVLGGPPDDGLTSDGYRFVGGEAGYIFIGRPKAAR